MQAVHRASALSGQLIATVRQQPQHGSRVLELDPAEIGFAQRHARHARRVDAVGLASVAPGEHAGASGEGRRDIEHVLTPRHEVLREVPAEARRTSTAHVLSGQRSAQASNRSTVTVLAATRISARTPPPASSATAVCEALCGSIPIVVTRFASSATLPNGRYRGRAP